MTTPTGILFTLPRVAPISAASLVQPGCYACFFITQTTTPTDVYADGELTTPLSQPTPGSVNPSGGTVANSAGQISAIYLNPSVIYRVQLYTAGGSLISDTDPVTLVSTPSSSQIGSAIFPQTPAEKTAEVTPTNYSYQAGDPRRYGATGGPAGTIPSVDDSAPWAVAVSTGYVNLPQGCAFKVVTGASYTGQMIVQGSGQTSQLYCDTTVLSITDGTGSILDNFYMGNITAPWVVTRNPADWGAVIPSSALVQSSTVLGYQPTVNDPEYSTWIAAIAAVGTQNIGPVLFASGAASNITVTRIFGNFVRVEIRDAINSTIRDCDIRGGKGQWGALEFDNWTNGVQRGSGNRAINNRVQYSSFTGTFFSANDDFTNSGNQIYYGGESGIKTLQATGAQFTGSLNGASSGTLTGAITNGSYTCVFSDGEVRTITVTGGTAVAWTGALGTPSVGILTASIYQTTLNPQCFRGQMNDNHCNFNFFDGCDCYSTFSPIVDAAQTYHSVVGNHCYNNGHQGMNCDGQFNSYVSNKLTLNNTSGMAGTVSRSLIADNDFIDNNQVRNSSLNDCSISSNIGLCKISGNKVYAGPGQNNFGIYAPGTHFIGENFGDESTFFFGNTSQIPSVVQNYADAFTGLLTDQAFTLILQNNGGVIQHAIVSDFGSSALGNLSSRVNAASSSFTTTPTGTDATTAFAAGAKIGATTAFFLWLDVAAQVGVMADLVAVIATNSTGTAVNAMCQFDSININGVTRNRLAIGLTKNDGTGFNINTTNITSTNSIRIQFKGKLS